MGIATHTRPDGTSAITAFIGVVPDYTHISECGFSIGILKTNDDVSWFTVENLASLVVQRWMASPPHKAILMKDIGSEIDMACGIGLDWVNGNVYVTYNPYLEK